MNRLHSESVPSAKSVCSHGRAGFTLLEVVLALGLSSFLLAAVYAAMQMHWTYSMTGQVEMERSQLARAIFRRIEIDLRSVVFRSSSLSSSSSTSTSSSTASSTTSSSPSGSSSQTGTGSTGTGSSSGTGTSDSTSGLTSGSTESGETTSPQKTGMFGESQTIVLHCSLPSRMASTPAGGSSASTDATMVLPPGDLQSVAYFLRGSSSALAQQLSSGVLATTDPTAGGLCRMQGDRAAMQVADEAGDLSSLASRTKLLAVEVASIQFEFFDGVTWTTSWDSGSTNTLPNAVRITMTFSPPDDTKRGWFARPVSTSTDSYTYTVAMPLAEPYVSE